MPKPGHLLPPILRSLQPTVLALTILCVLAALAARPAQAQTFSVIHNFTGGADGSGPMAGVTFGGRSTLDGTTTEGGGVIGRNCDPRTMGCGVVFAMTQHNSAWVLTPLYAFTGFNDGYEPEAPVAFGPDGLLYGSTAFGGNNEQCGFTGCGVVFTLQPPPTVCRSVLCAWVENPIYQFASLNDGEEPTGDLAFDQAGNVYGTTVEGGGLCSGGQVFQLTGSGPSWTKTTVYDFLCGSDGANPSSGVIIDGFGNLYGVVSGDGAYGYGAVYEVTPSGSGWTETLIYSFQNGTDGEYPYGPLVMDAEGNLYGTAGGGGTGGGGTVFELSPSGGGWTFSLIASLPGGMGNGGPLGLAFDTAGNLYGTTYSGGSHRCGNVYNDALGRTMDL